MSYMGPNLDDVLATRIREQREAKGFTQADLAARMEALGFPWSRMTVTEVERSQRRRRVAIDEWIGLASALGVSAITLLATPKGTRIEISSGLSNLSVFQLLKLVAGPDALNEWQSQIATEAILSGAGEGFSAARAELDKPMAALHKIVDELDRKMKTFERAAAFGDLALAKKGDAK
jgi:transcriptional regulator with XRE-family HTH domain